MQKLIPLDSRRRKSFRTRLQALRAGLTTLARDRRGEGYLDMAMKILNGEEVDDQVYAKVTVVGLDNLDEYLASIEG